MTKITVLCEDTVYRPGLLSEHGLSFLVEHGSGKWLFDTAQTVVAAHNAGRLRKSLSSMSGIVLSHGHYDHTGGLPAVLESAGQVKVYCHPGVLSRRFAVREDGRRHSTAPKWRKKDIEEAGAEICFNTAPAEIGDGVWLSGEIPDSRRYPMPKEGRLFLSRGKRVVRDTSGEEQCMIIDGAKGLIVLLGCSHRGVENMLRHATAITGKKRIYAVIGGMHLVNEDGEGIARVVNMISRLDIKKAAPCHCTGPKGISAIRDAYPRRYIMCSTGVTIEL
jgi:7,8-dihydropterin-6-yl-methyl-4-(beta-D-ribofuranosyl)aminobenzene 5'-phosphate synthase